MTNCMALSGLRENVVCIKILLTTDGTNGYAKSDMWCQRWFWQPLVRDYTSVVGVTQAVQSPVPCVAEAGVGPVWGATEGVLSEMKGRDVEQDVL